MLGIAIINVTEIQVYYFYDIKIPIQQQQIFIIFFLYEQLQTVSGVNFLVNKHCIRLLVIKLYW